MTRTLVKFSIWRAAQHSVRSAALLCSALAALSGCAERKVRAYPWAAAAQVRPNPPAVRALAIANLPDIAPNFSITPPENNAKFLGVRSVPVRPHAESPRPTGAANNSRTQTLVPELSPQEMAAAQQQFSESVAIVEKNLANAKNRNLSPRQTDTVSKVNAFLTEAHEASTEGDWGRARNLAKKAQILSEDLATSF